MTFAFDLTHGFGFAGALQEFGLPANAMVPALAAFNFGVEIGQVAIVSIVVPALMAVDQMFAADRAVPLRAAPLVYALSAVITVLGGYWLLTRVFVGSRSSRAPQRHRSDRRRPRGPIRKPGLAQSRRSSEVDVLGSARHTVQDVAGPLVRAIHARPSRAFCLADASRRRDLRAATPASG